MEKSTRAEKLQAPILLENYNVEQVSIFMFKIV